MPIIKYGGFVDIRLLTITINDPITLHYVCRASPLTGENQLYFLLREIDYKIIRSNNVDAQDSRSESAIKILVNQVCKDAHVWTTSEELKAFKAINLLTLRAPRAALISAPTLIRLLRHFECDIKALALEGVLISLQASARFQHKFFMGLKAAVMAANKKFDLPPDHATSKQLLEKVLQGHGLPYGPPWAHFYGEPENTPALDVHSCLLLSHIISHPHENATTMAWDSLIAKSVNQCCPDDIALALQDGDQLNSTDQPPSSSTSHFAHSTMNNIELPNPSASILPQSEVLHHSSFFGSGTVPATPDPSALLTLPPISWREQLFDVSEYSHNNNNNNNNNNNDNNNESENSISPDNKVTLNPQSTQNSTQLIQNSTQSTHDFTTQQESSLPNLPQPTIEPALPNSTDLHNLPQRDQSKAKETKKIFMKSIFAHTRTFSDIYIAYSTHPVTAPPNHPIISRSPSAFEYSRSHGGSTSNSPAATLNNVSAASPTSPTSSENRTNPNMPEKHRFATKISFSDSLIDTPAVDLTTAIESNANNAHVISLHRSNNITSHISPVDNCAVLNTPLQTEQYDQVIKVSITHNDYPCARHNHDNDVPFDPSMLTPYITINNGVTFHPYSSYFSTQVLSSFSESTSQGTSSLFLPYRPINFVFFPMTFIPPLPLRARFGGFFADYPTHMLSNARKTVANQVDKNDNLSDPKTHKALLQSTQESKTFTTQQEFRHQLTTLTENRNGLTLPQVSAKERIQAVLAEISNAPSEVVPFMWEELKQILHLANENGSGSNPSSTADTTRPKPKAKKNKKSRQQVQLEIANTDDANRLELNSAYSAARFAQTAMDKIAAIIPTASESEFCKSCISHCLVGRTQALCPLSDLHYIVVEPTACQCRCHICELPTTQSQVSLEFLNEMGQVSESLPQSQLPKVSAGSTNEQLLNHISFHLNTSKSFLQSQNSRNDNTGSEGEQQQQQQQSTSPTPPTQTSTAVSQTSPTDPTTGLEKIHQMYYREFGHFAKLPPRCMLGLEQHHFLSQPGVVPFNLLIILAVSYFHQRTTNILPVHRLTSSEYACEVMTSSFSWLLSQLHTPVTFSSTLIEYDLPLSNSFFANNIPPDLFVVPDLASHANDNDVPLEDIFGYEATHLPLRPHVTEEIQKVAAQLDDEDTRRNQYICDAQAKGLFGKPKPIQNGNRFGQTEFNVYNLEPYKSQPGAPNSGSDEIQNANEGQRTTDTRDETKPYELGPDSWLHPSHHCSKTHGLIAQSFRNCFAATNLMDPNAVSGDWGLNQYIPKYGITPELTSVLYPQLTHQPNDIVQDPPLNDGSKKEYRREEIEAAWTKFQHLTDALFPYEITRETLPLWRGLLFHIEQLTPLQTYRLWRHCGSIFNVYPDTSPTQPLNQENMEDIDDSAPAENQTQDGHQHEHEHEHEHDGTNNIVALSQPKKRQNSKSTADTTATSTRNKKQKYSSDLQTETDANVQLQLTPAAPYNLHLTKYPYPNVSLAQPHLMMAEDELHNQIQRGKQQQLQSLKQMSSKPTSALIADFYANMGSTQNNQGALGQTPLNQPTAFTLYTNQANLIHFQDVHPSPAPSHTPASSQPPTLTLQTSTSYPQTPFQFQPHTPTELSQSVNISPHSATSTSSRSPSTTPFYDNSNDDFEFEVTALFPQGLQNSYEWGRRSQFDLLYQTGADSESSSNPQSGQNSDSHYNQGSPLLGKQLYSPLQHFHSSPNFKHAFTPMNTNASIFTTTTSQLKESNSFMTPPFLAMNNSSINPYIFDHQPTNRPSFFLNPDPSQSPRGNRHSSSYNAMGSPSIFALPSISRSESTQNPQTYPISPPPPL